MRAKEKRLTAAPKCQHDYVEKVWSFGPYIECSMCDHTLFLNSHKAPICGSDLPQSR